MNILKKEKRKKKKKSLDLLVLWLFCFLKILVEYWLKYVSVHQLQRKEATMHGCFIFFVGSKWKPLLVSESGFRCSRCFSLNVYALHEKYCWEFRGIVFWFVGLELKETWKVTYAKISSWSATWTAEIVLPPGSLPKTKRQIANPISLCQIKYSPLVKR